MNNKRIISVLSIVALCMGAGQLLAHHGTYLSYDLDHNPITLKGTVSEFRWQNPHVLILLDAKDASGKVVSWTIEGNSIIAYAHQGYSRTTLKSGDPITALVYPSKVPNTTVAVIAHVTLADGKEILRFQKDTPGLPVD